MMDDYRDSHVRPDQVTWYEHGVYKPGTYDSAVWDREQRLLLDIVGRHFEGRRVRMLDFACGTGRILSFLEPHVAEATGLDISDEMLALARPKVGSAKLVRGDLTADPDVVGGPFDLITAFRFLLNAQDALRHQALARLAAKLSPEGILVVNIHGNAWSIRGASYLRRRYLKRERIAQLSPARVRTMLGRHGLNVVEMHGIELLTPRLYAAVGARAAARLDRMLERIPALQRFAVDLIFVARPAGSTDAGRERAQARRGGADGKASGARPAGGLRWAAPPMAPRRLDLRVTRSTGSSAALRIWRPADAKRRAAARLSASMVAVGLGKGRPPPLEALDELGAILEAPPGAIVSMRSSRADRLVVGYAGNGDLRAVAKIGAKDDAGLAREAEVLRALAAVRKPFRVPPLRWAGEWRDRYVVATDAVPSPTRDADLSVAEAADICVALAQQLPMGPVVHGDLTPWNVLRAEDAGLYLLDWEESRYEDDPLYDLSHFVVQQGVLLGRFDPESSAKHLTAPGGSGWRYLQSIGVDPNDAREHVARYLRRTEWFSGAAGHRFRVVLGRVLYPPTV